MSSAHSRSVVRQIIAAVVVGSIPFAVGACIGLNNFLGWGPAAFVLAPTMLTLGRKLGLNEGPSDRNLLVLLAVILAPWLIGCLVFIGTSAAVFLLTASTIIWMPQGFVYRAWQRGLESGRVRSRLIQEHSSGSSSKEIRKTDL